MKFISYTSAKQPKPRIGRHDPLSDSVIPLCFPDGTPVHSLYDLIEQWGDLRDKLRYEDKDEGQVKDITLLAPLRGRDVLCVGYNYRDHRMEMQDKEKTAAVYPEHPIIFTKRASSITAHNTPIDPHSDVTSAVDYEGELGIIIGKGGTNIRKEDAWSHIWGATIINDVTARDRQNMHKQFYIGKSLDTFCPMGPYAVPVDAIDIKAGLNLTTRVNSEVRQSQRTNELIFDIPTLISTLSLGITLQPGDVIATGTPAGVGSGRGEKGEFLKEGDVVEVEIEGIGILRNWVGKDGEGKAGQVRGTDD